MYCRKCNREGEGKFCSWCGSEMLPSKGAYNVGQEQPVFKNEENIWYYALNEERKGPVSETEILRLLEAGYIHGNTLVWKQGFQNWLPINQSGIVMEKSDETVVNEVGNVSIILLVFVPIVSTLLSYLLAGWLQISSDKLMWVAYVLNILCCTFDYYRVKNAGYNMDKLNAAFLFFIPLYIYRRMVLVNGKKWMFTLLWTAVFALDIFIPASFWVKAVNMSNPAMITVVKEGSFVGCEGTTVEKMFTNALDNCLWNTYMGSDREIFVQVKGVLQMEGEGDEPDIVCDLETVFKINMDSSYEVIEMKENGSTYSDDEITNMLTYLYQLERGSL